MRKHVEDEECLPLHRKKKHRRPLKWIIEYMMPKAPIKEWRAWRKWKAYDTEKKRDLALKSLDKSKRCFKFRARK